MKLMQYDRIARKYHLLWHSNQKSIIVQIHNDCVKSFKPVSIDSPWVRAMSQTHDADGLLDSFCGDLSSDYFGFKIIAGFTCSFYGPIGTEKKTRQIAPERI